MDIENLATSAVKDSIARTDVLSSFINDGDKEPSWDGSIYIHTDKRKRKKGIKKVPIQVKGELRKKLPPKKAPKFSVSMVDLENWLNHGGIILFVVLIDESGDNKEIYYSSLLPVKIRNLITFAHGKKSTSVALTCFPTENNEKVAILLNFYDHMQKQSSFATAPLYSIDELNDEGVLENVSFSVTTYGSSKSTCEIESLLFRDDVYMYANIIGSPVPQPLPDIPVDLHIARDVPGEIKVKEHVFYQGFRMVRCAEETDINIGKSMVFKLFPGEQRGTLSYTLGGMLSDYIRDTECLIAILENKEITINGAVFPFTDLKNVDIERYKKNLAYFLDIQKMLTALGVNKELDCSAITDQDEKNIRNFTNALVYGSGIDFTGCTDTMLFGRFKIANLVLLIWAEKTSEYGYRLESFFNDHQIALFENSDEKMEHPYPISRYALLKKQDFIDAANIDYKSIRDDISQNDTSPIVTEQLTLFMLEMLKAYDEQSDKNPELLATAEQYCNWLIDNSEGPNDMTTLNRLQIAKRKRDLEPDEVVCLQMLRGNDHEMIVRCAANLLLGRSESAQDCFDELDAATKDWFIEFPICHFGNLVYEKSEA